MNTSVNLPAAWANEAVLDGVDLVAKQDLVGVPFRITAVWFEVNKQGVEYVYVEAETADLTPVTFNDSSTGVRQQVIDYLAKVGKEDLRERLGEVENVSLVIPRGLRVSEFEVRDERGRTKLAKTFYLTTSGARRGDAAKATPAKATAAKK